MVLKVDESEEKISLGMKQTEQDPWMVLPLKYPIGTRINGKVRNLTSFGAFVEIEPGIDGLIHISDMSWTRRIQHPSEIIKKGDDVEVVILNIDGDNKRISLGLKQAEEDPWLKIGETLPIGTELRGKAVRLMDKGVVVDLGNDLEGFSPMSQLGLADIQDPGEAIQESQPLDVKVLEVDPIHHRIVVAVIGYPEFDAAELAAEAAARSAARAASEAEDDFEMEAAAADPLAASKPAEADTAVEAEPEAKAEVEAPAEEAVAEEVVVESAPVEEPPAEAAAAETATAEAPVEAPTAEAEAEAASPDEETKAEG